MRKVRIFLFIIVCLISLVVSFLSINYICKDYIHKCGVSENDNCRIISVLDNDCVYCKESLFSDDVYLIKTLYCETCKVAGVTEDFCPRCNTEVKDYYFQCITETSLGTLSNYRLLAGALRFSVPVVIIMFICLLVEFKEELVNSINND